MENFNADEKMLVLMQLEPKEVLIVCDRSKEMNAACRNNKYNLLWQKKLKEDFDVDYVGNEGYEKYQTLATEFKMIDSYLKVEPQTGNKYLGKKLEDEFYIELFNNPIIFKYFMKLLNTDPKYKYLTRNFRFSNVDRLLVFIQYNRDKFDENTLQEKYDQIGNIILTNPLMYKFG